MNVVLYSGVLVQFCSLVAASHLFGHVKFAAPLTLLPFKAESICTIP